MGVRWRHQGRNRSGVDCCGLVIVVGRALGLVTYDTSAYGRRTTGGEFLKHFYDAGMIPKDLKNAEPGDVLVTHDHMFPCHCGVFGDRGGLSFIHAYATRKCVVEAPAEEWMRKAVQAFAYPEK